MIKAKDIKELTIVCENITAENEADVINVTLTGAESKVDITGTKIVNINGEHIECGANVTVKDCSQVNINNIEVLYTNISAEQTKITDCWLNIPSCELTNTEINSCRGVIRATMKQCTITNSKLNIKHGLTNNCRFTNCELIIDDSTIKETILVDTTIGHKDKWTTTLKDCKFSGCVFIDCTFRNCNDTLQATTEFDNCRFINTEYINSEKLEEIIKA